MHPNLCGISSVTGHIGCHNDVTDIVDNSCSGKRGCDFSVVDDLEGLGLSPCPQGLQMYLEASYTCVEGNPAQIVIKCCIHVFVCLFIVVFFKSKQLQ